MKHTPGPWHADKTVYRGTQGGKHAFVEVAASGKAIWVARVQTFSDDTGEYAANARLIAAAPDLLEAAKIAQQTLDGHRCDAGLPCLQCDARSRIVTAIAKAEARS